MNGPSRGAGFARARQSDPQARPFGGERDGGGSPATDGSAFEQPESAQDGAPRSGLVGFIRSLLSGIPWSEGEKDVIESHYEPPRGQEVKIRNTAGRTRVVGEERSDIAVTLERNARAESKEAAQQLLEAIRVVPVRSGGVLSLEVEVPTRWNRHGCANIDVRVPRGLRLDVHTRNGRLCLQGLRGSVKARSSNGSVRIADVTGDIEVSTANASVACECTCGRLVARSSNGKIALDDHRGSVDASTSNGVIHVGLDEIGEEGVVLATSNGRIVLELPEHVDAEVDIRVDNGVIRTDRTIESQAGVSSGRLRGRLGRGGCPIKLRTSNGTISLK